MIFSLLCPDLCVMENPLQGAEILFLDTKILSSQAPNNTKHGPQHSSPTLIRNKEQIHISSTSGLYSLYTLLLSSPPTYLLIHLISQPKNPAIMAQIRLNCT